MYYNNVKSRKKDKCVRVLKIYCSSIEYHQITLENDQTTFDDFKCDIFALIESLKRYVKSNRIRFSKETYGKITKLNISSKSEKKMLLAELDGLYQVLKTS
jgi:hypothetical protein